MIEPGVMMPKSHANDDALDRHALISAVWLPAGFVTLGLMHHGFADGGPWWVLAGFATLLVAYALHVVVNAVFATPFSRYEVALALVIYAAAGIALVLAVLLQPGFAETYFLPVSGGMAALAAVVIFYMVTRSGSRVAFGQFDIIRNNNPRRASGMLHRGGRK